MDAQQLDKVDSGELSKVALKLFFAIADEWSLTENQRLVLTGMSSRTTLQKWRNSLETGDTVRLGRDTLERLSYIAGIYKALQLLFVERAQWREWIRKPNRDFGGQSVLDRMLVGRVVDLADVRRYLDAWRGEHYE